MHNIDKLRYIFGRLFLLSNKLQSLGDQMLGEEMTIRQWLLVVGIAQFGDHFPTLGEVAGLMGTSHQNVKQLALKLQKKEFLKIEKNTKDLRETRLKLTEKNQSFWKRRQVEIKDFLKELFGDLSQEEMKMLCDCLNKLYGRVSK
ncbi:MarR family winged helix-turn-helix transcriptional regulator [Anaerosolibacter sp.]|uniref:MarR family winged helix-turn-helix transcriptional regulator n=1 Tax=Anaerosolibacter sp. TaxID=1872527 RepID=UPI0039EFBC31